MTLRTSLFSGAIALSLLGIGAFTATPATAAAMVNVAADVSGTYTWSQGGGGGGGETTLVLKQDGEKLTGTLTGGRGGEQQIENGSVDGNKIKFTVTREWNNNKMVTEYTGTVDGDSLKLTVTTSREIEATKKSV